MYINIAIQFNIAVSIVMQGKQMVPVLNSMGINAAVYGNHDFGESSFNRIINNYPAEREGLAS